MVEIGAVRIRKGIYRFESRKRFQYVQRYRAIERQGLDKLKDSIKSLISPKKAEEKPAALAGKKEAAAPGGFNMLLVGGAILLALLVIAGGFMLFQPAAGPQGQSQFTPVEKASLVNRIVWGDVLTAGPRGSDTHAAALLVDYNASGIQNYTVVVQTFEEKLPTEVFVLNSERIEATRYSDFITSLRNDLSSQGVVLNEISFGQLETVPMGAEVIVPSGVVPAELLVGKGNISRLLNEGVVLIYVGQSFKSVLNGSLVTTTPQYMKDAVPINFEEASPPQCTANFTLFQPLYKVTGWEGLGGASSVYGCISTLKIGSGTMLFIPQTVDGGWRSDPRAAAADITRLVVETPWASPDSAGSPYFVPAANVSAGITGVNLFYSQPYEGRDRSVKLYFFGLTPLGSVFQDMKVLRVSPSVKGELFTSQLAVTSTNVTGEQIRMNAKLAELTPASPAMFVVFRDSTDKEVARVYKGNINTQSPDVNLDVEIPVDQGEYLLSLEDDSGKTYAATYLLVDSVSITGPSTGPKPSIYIFNVDTPVTLKTLSVDIDNGKFKKEFPGVSAGPLSVDVSQYTGGDSLPYGNHTFKFMAGNLEKSVQYNRSLPPSPFPPELLLIMLMAGGIVGVGVYFARREQVFFSIDVPDFPPVSRTKIPLNTEVVLSVFDKVNDTYRWEFTPLTSPEVKNGFKNIYFRGNPIYITDYNTEFLLNELVRRKSVKEFLDYYGLAEWEQKSGKTVRYLAMLRKLRDICVNNAIPFTQLGESAACDSEITVVGQQMFLHFYDKTNAETVLQRSLSTISTGITIVMFKDGAEKGEFAGLLNSSSKAPLVMKLEVESNSVLLLTYPELEKMVQEFKGV